MSSLKITHVLTFIEIVDITKGNNTIGKIMKAKIPVNCLFQGCYNPEYEEEIKKCKDKCFAYNQLNPNDRETQEKMLRSMLGKMGKEVIFTPPFWCDYGYNISVGDYFYSNHNLIITDGAEVTFGDNVFIAPNCCFTLPNTLLIPNSESRDLRSLNR